MRVAMASVEAAPFMKVGGLGDVLGSLPQALNAEGITTTVYLPWYRGIEAATGTPLSFSWAGKTETIRVGRLQREGVAYQFLAIPELDIAHPYRQPNEFKSFVRFSQAAAAAIAREPVDVVHAHDWQTAHLITLVGQQRARPALVFTIHNLAFQGRHKPTEFFQWTGLPKVLFTIDGLEFHGDVNLMKGAIHCADAVTTVSPTYAQEIQSEALGAGLEGVLRKHRSKLYGILNGLDVATWNPETDSLLAQNYSRGDLRGKATCERALQKELGLQPPVIAMVTRLSHQKGIDVALETTPELAQKHSLAILGSGEDHLATACRDAEQAYPDRVRFIEAFDDALAHRMYAGANAFLMPSRYEPCGLAQLIALRYGTPPIAHATGGLRDTISDGKTGFLFQALTPTALIDAIHRFDNAEKEQLMRAALSEDVGWDRSAAAYARLYREISVAEGPKPT